MPGRVTVRGLVGYFHLKTVEDGPVEGREQKMVKDRSDWERRTR